jgi:excisionase family DNA binding protein
MGDCALAATEETAGIARLLSKKELARLLGVSFRSIDRHVAAGQLPRPIKVGALSRWRREDIDAWLTSQAAKAEG